MIRCWVTLGTGGQMELPTAVSWRFCYGTDTPCDSFFLRCLWEKGQERLLSGACRFFAEWEGERAFTGVVDEFTVVCGQDGLYLELSGRGMAALLLDNEAMPAEYQRCTRADIVADHVAPYGVEAVGGGQLPAVAGFTVTSGESEWSVVRRYACYYGGVVPRFDRQGRLVLDAWRGDRERLDRSGDGVLQYVMLEGEPGHQDSLLRTEYCLKALTDGGVEVERLDRDTANWNRAQAAARIASWLEEFGDGIEVIFSNNDDMALGAIDALADTPRDRWPLIVGVDATAPALEAVAAGQLYGTVHNDGRGQAQAMLDLTLALWNGEDPGQAVDLAEGHYVWLPYRQVTLENLDEFLEK